MEATEDPNAVAIDGRRFCVWQDPGEYRLHLAPTWPGLVVGTILIAALFGAGIAYMRMLPTNPDFAGRALRWWALIFMAGSCATVFGAMLLAQRHLISRNPHQITPARPPGGGN